MRIELIPNAGGDDAATRAVASALAKAGLIGSPAPPAFDSPWRSEGIRDAVERPGEPTSDYVFPRRTLGAPRA